MSTPNRKVAESNRSMAVDQADGGELFFFPKRRPPVSVRAASREDAERILAQQDLEATNAKEL
jgi:hypothetical protein